MFEGLIWRLHRVTRVPNSQTYEEVWHLSNEVPLKICREVFSEASIIRKAHTHNFLPNGSRALK